MIAGKSLSCASEIASLQDYLLVHPEDTHRATAQMEAGRAANIEVPAIMCVSPRLNWI
jgi:hypothetical protein